MAIAINPFRQKNTSNKISPAHGFSLLEILVVLFIVGMVSSVATVGIRGTRENTYRDSAKHLYLQMRLAAEDAVLLNAQYGLDLYDHEGTNQWAYRWLVFDVFRESWSGVGQGALSSATFPTNAQLDLETEGETLEINVSEDNPFGDETDPEVTPDIIFLSSGEVTPFRLRIDNADDTESETIILSSDAHGRLKMGDDTL